MKKVCASLLSILLSVTAFAQYVIWENAIDVSSDQFGNKAISLELSSSGEPMVLHGTVGEYAGLYLTRMVNGEFTEPVAVTSDTDIFLSDAEGPTMAVSGDKIVVGYQIYGEWSTGARVVISNDGGDSWSDPIILNSNLDQSYFMPCMGFTPNDEPFLGVKWGNNPTLEGVMTYDSSSSIFNEPVDGSAGMEGASVCECCPSLPFSHEGKYYNLIRGNDANIRDIWLASSEDGVVWDNAVDIDPTNWYTNTCPATGADYAITSSGTLMVVYMSAGSDGSRVYYSEVDLETFELISSGLIDEAAANTENNPSVSTGDNVIISAWERNSGGYDIMIDVTIYEGSDVFNSIDNITESLDFTGHKRYPDIKLYDNYAHLVFKSTSEGVVKYMRGNLLLGDVDENTNDEYDLRTTPYSWVVSAGVKQVEYMVIDLQGRVLESGKFEGSLAIDRRKGISVLVLTDGSSSKAFKLY